MNATVRILRANIEFDEEYTYIVPEALKSGISVGVFVIVPFGKGDREETGIVTALDTGTPAGHKIKEIRAINEAIEPLTDEFLTLADNIAERYVCSRTEVIRTLQSPVKLINIKEKYVSLNVFGEELENILKSSDLRKISQINVLKVLAEEPSHRLEINALLRIADAKPATVSTLKCKGFVTVTEETKRERAEAAIECKSVEKSEPLPLTPEQDKALFAIKSLLNKGEYGEFLLHGITGSGKTEVYLRLLAELLEKGEGAILLVPEIALTAQMIKRVQARFGENVAVLHSRISAEEKMRAHAALREGKVKLAMGVRSAVFAPVKNLRLIIVDEEQEPSYKSFETRPYYSAPEVAAMRMKNLGGVVVYGSATPRVKTYYRALRNEIGYAYMGARASAGSELPKIEIADMKKETANGNYSPLSESLLLKLAKNKKEGEQSIIFVPRRGYSAKLVCLGCGKTLGCPHCRVAVSYHKAANRVVCHYCGSTMPKPERCPLCGSLNLVAKTYGTEMVAEELEKAFPPAEVVRMDTDTTKTRLGHASLLEKFEKENVPFLVGTQMVAKGLDFPNVTLVGVVGADSLTSQPDYDANERAFVLLTQVFGRAGRASGKKGVGVVQTYNPNEKVYEYAAKQDYFAFYRDEIEFRRTLGYPPFSSLATVSVSSTDDRLAYAEAARLRETLCKTAGGEGLSVMSVARGRVPKINDKYRWEFMVKSESHEKLIKAMNEFRETVLVPYAKKRVEKFKAKCLINIDIE